MKFVYEGDRDMMTMYGITFPRGVEVEVPSHQEAYTVERFRKNGDKYYIKAMVVDKLRGQPDFREVASDYIEDERFDPEIHAVDSEGNPILTKSGNYRKKPGRK